MERNMAIDRVGIIGRGAVGVLYGNLLNEKLGREGVCFIADERRAVQYRDNPVCCNGRACDFTYVSDGKAWGQVDLLLIAVKYPVLLEALESVRDFVGEDTIILSLLNGVTSEGITERTLGKGVVIHSIAQLMDSVKAGNQVDYTRTGEIVIGTNDERRLPRLREVEAFFRETGIPHHVAADIIYEQWSKLMLNCGINQICAVYDIPYRGCQTGQPYQQEFRDTMEEVRQIAVLEGIPVQETEIEKWLAAIDGLDADAMPSMRQDILAKRNTEVDLFSKTIMDLAKKHGLEAPLNTKLYRKIKELEETFG